MTIIVRTAAQFRSPTSNESLDLVIQSLCPNDVRAFAIADTQKEHSRDADIAGLSNITLESLQHFRGQIQDKTLENVHLLFQLTWIHSAPRLARALDF